jgi:indole-3-glycerol phosphate synthase
MSLLDDIVARKRREIEAANARLPLEELKQRVARRRAERPFREALRAPGRLSLIAELKRKSPSGGMLRERFDPVSLAQTLQEAGAAALSVLTDEPAFGGCLDFLRDAKQFTEIPALRKDFLIDPYQIYESALYEADAVLLIARILPAARLAECLRAAEALALEALIEVHSEAELEAALSAGAQLIGVNHRDLDTLRLDLSLSSRLIPRIPEGIVIVAESGLTTAADIRRMRDLGAHAVLIGEALMRAPDPAATIRELFTEVW